MRQHAVKGGVDARGVGAARACSAAFSPRPAGGAGGAACRRHRLFDAAAAGPDAWPASRARSIGCSPCATPPRSRWSINSPGGSPAQSHLIFRRIRELAEENNRKVIAFVEDAAASGGYMIACAADEIIADPNSIVGSIGVVGGSFGFDKLIAKIGVERRLYTSGEHKAMLDPFLPENAGRRRAAESLQREIHEDFIALVKSRRGGKLNGPEDELVLRRILDRPPGARARPGRRDRRSALDLARALRRQSRTCR